MWARQGEGASGLIRGVFSLCSCQAKEDAVAERIDDFIVKLKELKQGASPFTLVSSEGLLGVLGLWGDQ